MKIFNEFQALAEKVEILEKKLENQMRKTVSCIDDKVERNK